MTFETYEHCFQWCPPSRAHRFQTTFVNPLPRSTQSHYPHPKAVQAIYHPGGPFVVVSYLAEVRGVGLTWTGTRASVNVRARERVLSDVRRIDRGCIRARSEVDVDGSWARRKVGLHDLEIVIVLGPLHSQHRIIKCDDRWGETLNSLFSSSSNKYLAFLRTPSTHC